MSEAKTLGQLLVQLGLDSTALDAGADKGKESLHGLEGAMESAIVKAELVVHALEKVADKVIDMVKESFEGVSAQLKLANSLGGTVAAVQTLNLAFDEAGISASRVDQAMKKMNLSIGEAIVKGGPAAEAFAKIHLNAKDLAEMELDKRFEAIADGISHYGTSAEQASLAAAIFGARATEITNAMRDGGEDVRKAREELESYGALLSQVDATNIKRATEALERFHIVSQGVSNLIASKFAPYLEVIAEDFKKAAAESHGWSEQVSSAFEGVLKAVGFVGDAMRGLHVVFDFVVAGASQLAADLFSIWEGIATGISSTVDFIIRHVNAIISALNIVTGKHIAEISMTGDSEVLKTIHLIGDTLRVEAVERLKEFNDLAAQPLPSEGIKKYLDDVKKAADAASEATLNAIKPQNVSTGESDEDRKARLKREDEAEKAAEREAERQRKMEEEYEKYLKRQAQMIERENMSDLERLNEKYKDEQAMLEIVHNEGLISDTAYKKNLLNLENKHARDVHNVRLKSWADIKALTQESWSTQLDIVSGTIEQMSSSMASGNKTMFEIHKAAALGQAIISGYRAVMGAFAAGCEINLAVGIAAAAAAGIFAGAQIEGIASSSYGGGGGGHKAAGGGSGGGGAAAAAAAPHQDAGPPGVQHTLAVQGLSPNALFSGSMVRALAKQMLQFQKDGGKVVLT